MPVLCAHFVFVPWNLFIMNALTGRRWLAERFDSPFFGRTPHAGGRFVLSFVYHLDGLMLLTKHFLNSESLAPRLRVGVLLDQDSLLNPFADVLDHIQQCNFADIVLRVYNAETVSI